MQRETLVSAEGVVQLVESYPRTGQIEDGIYIGRQYALNRVDQVVDLIAIGTGAEKLSEDSTVRCVVLERNPNIWGREDAVTLRIGQDLGGVIGIRSSEVVYRKGVACGGESDLARTILGNIRELVKV